MFTAWKHFVITIGLVLALTLSWSSTAKSEKTVIGYSAVSALLLPYWIAKEVGFYRGEGLDSDLVLCRKLADDGTSDARWEYCHLDSK